MLALTLLDCHPLCNKEEFIRAGNWQQNYKKNSLKSEGGKANQADLDINNSFVQFISSASDKNL